MPADRAAVAGRRKRASALLKERGLAALLLSPSSDLAYLCGYRMFGSERLTCLVLAADGATTLVVPKFESPRAQHAAPDLPQRTWEETEDPYAMVASLLPGKGDVAVADQMSALFTLGLQKALSGRAFVLASTITRELRMRKDAFEREALRAVSASADRAYAKMLAHEFAGKRESEVGAEAGERVEPHSRPSLERETVERGRRACEAAHDGPLRRGGSLLEPGRLEDLLHVRPRGRALLRGPG